ncbi:MAG: ATPase, T2SS/T4P/T4SS family [Candidatus Omnitrophica bacterium]|nr:ATPase, T2SS/T4P/T4SS family [Candidatus Omnitrophota bacterium]
MEIRDLLLMCIDRKASDIHLTENEPPILRIDGKLTRTDAPALSRENLKKVVYGVLTDSQKAMFERDLELDFSLALPQLDRFRVNIHMQKGCVEAALRRVPLVIPTTDELGMPAILPELARRPNGLVLVTGPTGVSKIVRAHV